MKRMKTLILSLLLLFTLSITTGCGNGSGSSNLAIPGVNGPTITLNGDSLLISMVFQNLLLDGGARVNPIPKYPNSYIELGPDLQSDGTILNFNISLNDVFNMNLNQLDPQSLPGGRALPGVSSGRLPAVAFTIPKFKNLTVYLGPKIFGIFVPLNKLNMQGSIITARYKIGSKSAGNISLVGSDSNGSNAGMLLLLDMSRTVQKKLKKIAKI